MPKPCSRDRAAQGLWKVPGHTVAVAFIRQLANSAMRRCCESSATSLRQSRHGRFCTASEKAGIRRRVRIQNAQLTAAKVSNPGFRGKAGIPPDISKGISQSGMCEFESSEVSQALGRSARLPKKREIGPEMPAYARSISSPNSQFGNLGAPIAESLQPRPRIFPFCRDCR
jgi:hypothetical protein